MAFSMMCPLCSFPVVEPNKCPILSELYLRLKLARYLTLTCSSNLSRLVGRILRHRSASFVFKPCAHLTTLLTFLLVLLEVHASNMQLSPVFDYARAWGFFTVSSQVGKFYFARNVLSRCCD